jgi:glycosyltransferase involved in cell wall biosynthesis
MHAPDAALGNTGILDADVESEFPDIFGGGPASIEASGIRLMGARPLAEVHGHLSRAAVAVVNPGHRSPETYCRAAVEAQAAGVPVVGALSGSLPEVVANERTGLLCREEGPQAIADAIARLLDDPQLARTMGQSGPAWANWLADYELIAPDWEGIAERAENDSPAPSEPRPLEDQLRKWGYGRARSWLRAALPSSVRKLVRPGSVSFS